MRCAENEDGCRTPSVWRARAEREARAPAPVQNGTAQRRTRPAAGMSCTGSLDRNAKDPSELRRSDESSEG